VWWDIFYIIVCVYGARWMYLEALLRACICRPVTLTLSYSGTWMHRVSLRWCRMLWLLLRNSFSIKASTLTSKSFVPQWVIVWFVIWYAVCCEDEWIAPENMDFTMFYTVFYYFLKQLVRLFCITLRYINWYEWKFKTI